MKPSNAPIEVTVLVTAHNEADAIEPCLRAIMEQDYPIERVEILLVDDRSVDGTAERALALNLPSLRVLRQGEVPAGLTARQGALDLGFREARGEIVLVTDAGGRVPREWIRELTGHLSLRDGAVGGPVLFAGGDFFLSRFQSIDSLVTLTLHRWANRHRHATGLLGANMAVRREAYLAIGGFPAIGQALSEDLALGTALGEAGWSLRYLTAPATLKPAEATLEGYLERARRRALNMPPEVRAVRLAMILGNALLIGLALFAGPPWGWLLAARYAAGLVLTGVWVNQYGAADLTPWVPLYEPILTLTGLYVHASNLLNRRWTWGGVTYGPPPRRAKT